MQQVKIFFGGGISQLEQTINDWLKENKNIEIVARLFKVTYGIDLDKMPVLSYTMAIFYIPAE